MSTVPADHLAFLRQRPFAFGCSLVVFPPEEIQVLDEMGNWMQALASGRISPVTADQEHFLLVDHEETHPETLAERAWLRLKGRREIERGASTATSHEPLPNYGMIEFDADRCWW